MSSHSQHLDVRYDVDAAEMVDLKQKLFLHTLPADSNPNSLFSATERSAEIAAAASTFSSLTELWATLPLQSPVNLFNAKSELERLATEVDKIALSTAWQSSPACIRAVIYTEDECGASVSRRIAAERDLELIQLDQLLDECIKNSYDPQKQSDAVAAMSEREVRDDLLYYWCFAR